MRHKWESLKVVNEVFLVNLNTQQGTNLLRTFFNEDAGMN